MSSEPSRPKQGVLFRLPDIVAALLVALLAFAWLWHVNPDPPVTHDATRDLLLARDCVELNQCHLIGASASVPGIYQGAVWLDLLTVVQLFGGDTLAARTLILGLLSLGLATLFVVTRRWIRPSLAFPAAVVALSILSLGGVPTLIINPSAVFFPDVICASAALIFALSGQYRYLAVAAFALSLATDTHVGALSLIPAVLAIACLGRERPWRGALLAIGVFFTTHLITSRAAFVANVFGLIDNGRLLLFTGGLIVAAVAAALLNSRFRRLSRSMRALVIGLVLVGPFTMGTLWLLIRQRHGFNITYWHPVIAPGAVLAVALVSFVFERMAQWRGGRWQTAALVAPLAAAAVSIGVSQHVYNRFYYFEPGTWSFDDTRRIAESLQKKGWNFEQMLTRVQGSFCLDLVNGMSVYTHAPQTGDSVANRRHVRVWRVPEARAPKAAPGLDIVPLRRGAVAVLSEITSWLDSTQVHACRTPIGGGTAKCEGASFGESEEVEAASFLFSERSFPHVHSVDVPVPYVQSYELRVLPSPHESRDIEIFDEGASLECGWQIAKVEGVTLEKRFSLRHVRIRSDDGRSGQIILEKPFGGAKCTAPENRNYTTCFLETAPGEDALRALTEGTP